MTDAQAQPLTPAERQQARALREAIPTGAYSVLPPKENYGWREICHDASGVVVAEVSSISVRHSDGTVVDRTRLPEFYAAAPALQDRYEATVVALEAERDATVELIRRLQWDVTQDAVGREWDAELIAFLKDHGIDAAFTGNNAGGRR